MQIICELKRNRLSKYNDRSSIWLASRPFWLTDNAFHEHHAGSFGTLAYRRTNSKAIFRISAFAAAVSVAMCLHGAIDEMRADFETAFVSTWKVPSGQILRHECSALGSIAHTYATQGGKNEGQSAPSTRALLKIFILCSLFFT